MRRASTDMAKNRANAIASGGTGYGLAPERVSVETDLGPVQTGFDTRPKGAVGRAFGRHLAPQLRSEDLPVLGG